VLARYRLEPEQVDLIIDRRLVHGTTVPFSEFIDKVPALNKWRTVTLLGGSFPKDLRGFSPGRHEHPRLEWSLWLDDWSDTTIGRCPDFGDYTIRYAFFDAPPRNPNTSASIRYASQAYWVVMRGEGVLNEGSAGFAQWPANAAILVEQPEFCGADFSEGDRYIAERAMSPEPTGTARTWLQAGINHHVTLVANQIAGLPARTEASQREFALRRRRAS
jgi:hypothetical protein